MVLDVRPFIILRAPWCRIPGLRVGHHKLTHNAAAVTSTVNSRIIAEHGRVLWYQQDNGE